MRKEKYTDLNHTNKLSHSFKFSSAVVLLSTTLLSYNLTSTPTVVAEDQTDVKATQEIKDKTSLKSRIEAAKKEIDRMKSMDDSDKTKFKTEVNNAERSSQIDDILKEVKEKETQVKEEGKEGSDSAKNAETKTETSSQDEASTTSRLKESSNRDEAQPNLNETQGAEDTETSERLDKVRDDLNEASQQTQTNDTTRAPQIADTQLDQEQANQSIDAFISDLEALSQKVEGGKLNDGEADASDDEDTQASQALNTLRNDINRVTTARETTTQDLDQYVQHKEANLETLENRLAERSEISQNQAQQLKDEIEKTKNSLKQQDAIISDHLKAASDKEQAVKEIIGSTVDEQRAQQLIDRIDTKGKTDAQIASQVLSQLDGLGSFTSDSLLESMFDKAEDKQALIQTLLSTKFEKNEAAEIARQMMAKHPNNAELVQLLKQHYGSDVSADDIIGNVIDQAHNKRQAIETILATKFNDAKARALANVIAKKDDAKVELLNTLRSGLDQPLNDLLQADRDITRLKSDIRHVFDPLKNTPSLLGQSNGSLFDNGLFGGTSLLDQLTSGGSLLDGIPDIPNPSQGHALSLNDSSDDFLSGLFDDEGDFDLPSTGEIAKQSALPLGIACIVIGGGLTWFVKRRKSKQS
ncbi:LPXTG cell wall anchor domain-containing protein [Staphylococcus simulans]